MNKQITAGIDVDDTLMPCLELFLPMVNVQMKTNLSIGDIKHYGISNMHRHHELLLSLFPKHPDIFRHQPLYPGAYEFVHNMVDAGINTFFITGAQTYAVRERMEHLMELFPFIPESHIIIAGDKSIITPDILVDDKPSTLLSNKSPIKCSIGWGGWARPDGAAYVDTEHDDINFFDNFDTMFNFIKNKVG